MHDAFMNNEADRPPLPPAARTLAQRVHAALMPDYNRATAVLWWTVVLLGVAGLLICLASLGRQGWAVWLQVALGTALAVASGLFPVRVPGTRNSYAAGEIFIFLLLLMQGPEAAALAAAGEAFMGSMRSSRRWTSRLFSPASALLSMLLAGSLLHAVQTRWPMAPAVLAAAMLFAGLYFFVNAALVAGLPQLKRGERFFQPSGLLSVFRWVGLAYAGSASLAALLYFTQQAQGLGTLLVMVPLLILLLVALHFYFKQQEESIKLLERSVEAEAAAARHLHDLQQSEWRFHNAFSHASIGMALMAFDGTVLQANPALARALGRTQEELVQTHLQDWVLPEERAALLEQLSLSLNLEFEGFEAEHRFVRADGSAVRLALHCNFFSEPDADEPCLILQALDVTARRDAEAGLAHLAFHDSLTGLPNRRQFMEGLSAAVEGSQRDPRQAWAVMFLDFDRFKHVNDSLGHDVGDELLKQVAQRLQAKLRPGDMVARLGGDEFVILARGVEQHSDAVLLAERLMASMKEMFRIGPNEISASASVGITFSALGYTRAEDVLRDADAAMYQAKSDGKARFTVFERSLHTAVSQRRSLEAELREAIARDQLTLEYEPVFKLHAADGARELDGFEALLRWHHPSGDTLLPERFMTLAENAGLAPRLTDFALQRACRALRQWQQLSPQWGALTVRVKLQAPDIADAALTERVGRAMRDAALAPQALTLEVAEGVLAAQPRQAAEQLGALRDLGVRLTVNGLGTGSPGLAQLAQWPTDGLKLDASIVRRLNAGPEDAAALAVIVKLGSTLRKTVAAEGIETAEQADGLRDLGVALGQGAYLSPPLSEAAAKDWLVARCDDTQRAPCAWPG
jgi:diguanylate cyclase (GGDEF)-like protein/PAS domain S-box-containing protein